MNIIKKFVLTAALAFLFIPCRAADITLGLMGAYGSSGYKGVKSRVVDIFGYSGPVPYLAFNTKYFYLILPQEAGVHVFKNKYTVLDLMVSAISGLDPDDSTDSQVKLVDKRDITITAGLRGEIKTKAGIFTAAFRGDVLGESDSLLARLSYRYNVKLTDKFSVTPSAYISWANAKYNNYRYGVSEKESVRSGLPVYNADYSVTPSAGLAFNYRFTKRTSAMLRGGYTFLSKEVKESPLVDKTGLWDASVGILYRL